MRQLVAFVLAIVVASGTTATAGGFDLDTANELIVDAKGGEIRLELDGPVYHLYCTGNEMGPLEVNLESQGSVGYKRVRIALTSAFPTTSRLLTLVTEDPSAGIGRAMLLSPGMPCFLTPELAAGSTED